MGGYRLYSNSFERTEELNPDNPKKVVFLSVEGTVTEVRYFKHLEKHLQQCCDAVYRVEILQRRRKDGASSPEHVIELLNEYMELRGEEEPEPWMERLKGKYKKEVIKALINKPLDDALTSVERSICEELLIAGVHLQYRKFLRNLSKGDEDIVAAVIDRDGGEGGRSRETIETCIEEAKTRGYGLFMTNPCFEFWLLLHLCDVKEEYANRQKELLENKHESSRKHTFVSFEVSKRAHHTKEISKKKFDQEYYPNIYQAINRAKDFATDINKIIDSLGTNLPELLSKLGVSDVPPTKDAGQ